MRKIILLLFLILPLNSLAAQQIGEKITTILESLKNPKIRLGLSIRELSTGRVIFEQKSRIKFIPASNMKLLTTAGSLEFLGAYHPFTTKIFATGSRQRGILNGDLWIVGGGEPNLSGRFYQNRARTLPRAWAAMLKNSGLWRIQGDLVMDDRLFDRQGVHPLWPKDQLDRWYCAEVSALTYNDNCVDLTLVGGRRSGRRVKVAVSPPTSYVKIINKLKTRRGPSTARFTRLSTNRIVLRGSLPPRGRVSFSVAIHSPPLFLGQVFREALKKESIDLRGRVRFPRKGEKRPAGVLYLEHRSFLRTILPVINKRSQNLHAEILFKALGQKLYGQPTFRGGQKAIEKLLQKAGISEPHHISDGSGMSRANRVTPHLITSLLLWISHRTYGTFFRQSLSLSGRDGTLKKRLTGPLTRCRIYAKTGTLNGVSALSGYGFLPKEKKWIVFSLLTEGFSSSWRARQFQDKIIRTLWENDHE